MLGINPMGAYQSPLYMSTSPYVTAGSGPVANPSPVDPSSAPMPQAGSAISVKSWLIGLIVILIALKLMAERPGGVLREDLAHTRVSFYSLTVITFSAVIGINLLKTATQKFYVPGLTELVNNS